jgi:hypothetical protein
MDRTGKLGALLRSARLNAILAWFLVAAIAITAVGRLLAGNLFWAGFAAATTIAVLIPPFAFGRPMVMLPWEVVLLAAVPIVGGIAAPVQSIEQLTLHVSVAALALIIAVELHVFTTVGMTDWFAVTFVVVTTLASEGVWSVLLWVSDELLRTQFIPDLRTLMIHFTAATLAGVGGGLVFPLYFRRIDELYRRCCPGIRTPPSSEWPSPAPKRVRDRFGISERRERQFVRLMQLSLVGILLVGIGEGELSVVVNSIVALVVTQLPAFLERDYDLSMDPGLVLWLTTAVFVHAVGALGPYQSIWWWDTLAHALSSSVVAAIGYTALRVVTVHSDDVRIPPRLQVLFILLFVVAAGVLWEVIEFVVEQLANMLAIDDVLVQYGLRDTMFDLVFDIVGGLVVAIWGAAYLTESVTQLSVWFETKRGN